MFVKYPFILDQATVSRGYTGKTRLRGFKTLNFWLVRAGGETSPAGGFPAVGNWRTRRDFACVVANYIRPKLLKHPLTIGTGSLFPFSKVLLLPTPYTLKFCHEQNYVGMSVSSFVDLLIGCTYLAQLT